MPITTVSNEAAMKTVLIGTETIPGTAVVPDGRLLVPFTAQPGIGAIRRSQDATGGYDRTATARRATADASATFGGPVTFQELAILPKYAMRGGITGSGDSGSPEAFTYTYGPSFNADDIDTATIQFGVDGLPWVATGVRFDEFNISGDATGADNDWQVGGTPFVRSAERLETDDAEFAATGGTVSTVVNTGAGWTVDQFEGAYIFKDYGSHVGEVRMVASNTADTITVADDWSEAPTAGDLFYISAEFPVLPAADYDAITMEGTEVYLDTYNSGASTLGTTLISDRVLSFNVTQTLALARKRRASGVIGRMGRGAREVSGTLRLEFDRWDEYINLRENTEMSLRIEKEGPAINGTTNHRARIDIERMVFDGWSEDEDTNNMTVSLAFVALQESPIWQISVTTDLATLP